MRLRLKGLHEGEATACQAGESEVEGEIKMIQCEYCGIRNRQRG